jgi:hypothetical protein
MSASTQIADAVKDLLESAVTLAGGLIGRDYVPVNELAEQNGLIVSVVPTAENRRAESRGAWRREYLISVDVWQKIPAEFETAADRTSFIDSRMDLVQQLADLLEDTPLSSNAAEAFPLDAVATLVEVETPYSPELIDELRLFEAEIVATYRTTRFPGE